MENDQEEGKAEEEGYQNILTQSNKKFDASSTVTRWGAPDVCSPAYKLTQEKRYNASARTLPYL